MMIYYKQRILVIETKVLIKRSIFQVNSVALIISMLSLLASFYVYIFYRQVFSLYALSASCGASIE